jgi:hypothetical protein
MKKHNTIHAEGLVRNDFDYLRDVANDTMKEAETFLFKSLEAAAAQAGRSLSQTDLQKVRISVTVQEID